jgi:hypothetical protein
MPTLDKVNLSGKRAFDFDIAATLCADKPVVIDSLETLFSTDGALVRGSITFSVVGKYALLSRHPHLARTHRRGTLRSSFFWTRSA